MAVGLVDAIDDEHTMTLKERAVKTVKALFEAIGVGDGETPECEDINCLSHRATELPEANVDVSMIALEEGQKRATPSAVKQIEDPEMVAAVSNPRMIAYENDARNMRLR